MNRTVEGIVHGRLIELADDLGLPDGEKVVVSVRPALEVEPNATKLPKPPGWYPGCSETAAGALADRWTTDDDRILSEIEANRRRTALREISE